VFRKRYASIHPLWISTARAPDQLQAAGFVGEDADDVRASVELLVDLLEHVGALEVFVVVARQTVKRPRLLDIALHPLAQRRILRLPASQPGRQIPPRLVRRAPVVKPVQFKETLVVGLARQMIERMA
jgi:hypothetical protein